MNIYLTKNGQQSGPYTIEQINAEASAGRATSGELAWMEGWSSWQPLSMVPGFIPSSPPPAPTAAYPPPLPSNDATPTEHDNLLRMFVDKNYEYYAKKWKQVEQKKSKNSWNWAAFFLGLGWMAYRKMYLYSWIFIGAIVVETICERAFGIPDSVSKAINMGIAVTYGWLGNYWYKLHVEKKLREIATTGASDEPTPLRIAKEGGTNIGAAIGLLVVFLILMFVAIAGSQ